MILFIISFHISNHIIQALLIHSIISTLQSSKSSHNVEKSGYLSSYKRICFFQIRIISKCSVLSLHLQKGFLCCIEQCCIIYYRGFEKYEYVVIISIYMKFIQILALIILTAAINQPIKSSVKKPQPILNLIHPNQQFSLRLWIIKDNQTIYQKQFQLEYSLLQPQIIENVTIDMRNLQQNITIYASMFKIYPFIQQIWHQQRNLTRFQRIYKVKDQIVGSYDPIDQIAIKNTDKTEEGSSDDQKKYSLHIAKDFNVVYVFSDIVFYDNQIIPDNLNLKFQKLDSSNIYKTPLDLTQFHVPFRTYNQVKDGQNVFNVSLHIFPYDLLKYSMFSQFGDPVKAFKHMGPLATLMQMGVNEDDFDQVKEMLFTNHIYLVSSYFILSLLQTILRFLTLKNQYQFWKNIDTNPGVSLKTLFFQLVCSIILTLYLIEYSSSKLVIFFEFLSFGITLWKLSRTFSLSLNNKFPFIHLQTSQLYKKRQNIDNQAIWYMNYLLIPLMFIYLFYSLYSKNWMIKNYYTFFLDTSVAFIAIFGFILMTPQLYINYKLKSVEHLNWRVLIYRFINTIIDDLFALMITMPLMRRLMYFRDDLIFLGYIYQRFIYRVDYTRIAPELGGPTDKQLLKQD